MLQLQRVQNQALKFITNTELDDFRSMHSLHQQIDLQPIDLIIHQQAKITLQNVQTNLPNIFMQFQENHPPIPVNTRFSSSRRTAERPQPLPIYS